MWEEYHRDSNKVEAEAESIYLITLTVIANKVKQSVMIKKFHPLGLITPNGYLSILNS